MTVYFFTHSRPLADPKIEFVQLKKKKSQHSAIADPASFLNLIFLNLIL